MPAVFGQNIITLKFRFRILKNLCKYRLKTQFRMLKNLCKYRLISSNGYY